MIEKEEKSSRALWEKLLAFPLLLGQLPILAGLSIPTNVWKVPFLSVAPDGLRLIHATNFAPEAEMIREMLAQNGFHPEFVPSTNTGVFGTTGSAEVYVPEAEAKDACLFLAELETEAASDPA